MCITVSGYMTAAVLSVRCLEESEIQAEQQQQLVVFSLQLLNPGVS